MSEDSKPDAVAAPRAKRGIPRTSLATVETYVKGVWDAARLGSAPDIAVARAIGGPDAKASGSGWRAKIAALRVFGLIERTEGQMKLSEIGHALLKDTDLDAQREGRRRAIFSVEPYATVLNQRIGHPLPPAPTLAGRFEHEFALSKADAKDVADAFLDSVQHAELLDEDEKVRVGSAVEDGPYMVPPTAAPPATGAERAAELRDELLVPENHPPVVPVTPLVRADAVQPAIAGG